MLTIEAQGLTKHFGSFAALEAASFHFEGAGAVGYLGPNGAGKTTTLKLLTRLLRPTSGSVRINGIDVTEDPKRALWDVGAVIESPEPYAQQTGQEALEMVGEFRGLGRETTRSQIARYTEILDLPPLDRRTGRLSKGQRQRIVIAGAMLSEPRIILLDEPTSGLDPAERVVIRNLLTALRGDRLILMSSHLLPEVTETCDRVIFVNQGRILLQDTIAGVAARFRVTQVDVEFTAPVAVDRWPQLGALVRQVAPIGDRKYRIDFDGQEETQAKLLEACQRIGRVLSFGGSTLSLEDAYLQLFTGNQRGGTLSLGGPGGAALPPPPPPAP